MGNYQFFGISSRVGQISKTNSTLRTQQGKKTSMVVVVGISRFCMQTFIFSSFPWYHISIFITVFCPLKQGPSVFFTREYISSLLMEYKCTLNQRDDLGVEVLCKQTLI